ANLQGTAKQIFYTSMPPGLEAKPRTMRLDIASDSPEAKVFAADINSWDLSDDLKHALIRKGDAFYVVPADGEAPAKLEKPVPLDRWSFNVDPKEEWHQIYRESWRMLRDYFYDPAMHGVDWLAIRQKYEPLVDRVADRSDLSEIMQEMSGELSALHIYVQFGDLRVGPDTIQPSSLGARLEKDATGGWKVEHIFTTDPDYPGETSPLSRPGVDIHDGDVILSINGRPLQTVNHPEELLAQQAGQQVLLEIQPPANAARRSVLVKPLNPEGAKSLRYSEWEYTRRQQTEALGKGEIGYVHLRNMGADSIVQWARDFYPVFNRQGLVIDMRQNQGGNTDSWILSRLMRKAWFHWAPRVGEPYPNMQYAFSGHAVVLCNEWTASDGEAFSEGFRRLGLGKVFGTRTWGGQIWLDSRRWLVDNGMCTAAEMGVFGPEGKWLIEGHGVDPDVVVDNGPHSAFEGRDLQLEAAVKHLQERIAKEPHPVPVVPPHPDKSGR
ncbi:MAG: protease, partial [Akkermansiaceae bacterium]|nr:protease [Akkermansiaceae bacterium]